MNQLQLLLFGVLFSGLGAIPPGLINLSVASRVISSGVRAGIMFSLGAAVIQFIYTFIAVFFIDLIIKNAVIKHSINWICGIVFFGLGIFYSIKKIRKIKVAQSKRDRAHFGHGIIISTMNMLIIPAWIFMAVWLKTNGFNFNLLREILFVSTGSAIGPLLIFLCYVLLSSYVLNRMAHVIKYTNIFLALVFFTFSAYQFFRIFYLGE